MKKTFHFFFIILISTSVFANDGAFYASGNQLIPINETDISVQKEILHLKKIQDDFIEVSVYYEFFNPKEEKEIIVGFEAFSPYGDVNGGQKNGLHPYMRDFTVNMNEKIITYYVAYVNDSLYNQNGVIKSIDLNNFEGNYSGNYVDFFYVYHFKAKFKKGLNIIKHTYNYDLSGSVDYHYDFEYVLTAANRWGNKQIDDFTLVLDMGEFETFNVNKSFFKNTDEWIINGIGKTENIQDFMGNDVLKFHIQKGTLIFNKLNFKPMGELFVYARRYFSSENPRYIPFSYYQSEQIDEPQNDIQKKILRNLPFARRGYIFKTTELKNYYEQLDWYIPNPDYIPEIETLTPEEQKWLKEWE